MKKILLSVLLLISTLCQAQWNPNGATSGNIYYTGGNVGIGTTTPSSLLHLANIATNVVDLKLPAGDLVFGTKTNASTTIYERMRVKWNGNVGIGTSNPNQMLTVNGTIYGKEVKVDLNVPGPDYVFDENYDLLSLSETEKYIKENKHLPEVPSAKEMEANGINVSEMNMLLLKKVEELTLHLISQNQKIEKLIEENNDLRLRVNKVEKIKE